MIFKRFALVLLSFLAACAPLAQAAPTTAPSPSPGGTVTPTEAQIAAQYPDLGPAPELENTVWLNTPHPLHLADLRGQVVLLEMWTFDCINCQHVIPSLRDWYGKYHAQGFEVIGNHFPEFETERDLANLKDAIQRLDISYPVAQDNDGVTWNAYHNAYWPTIYLIDKRGHLRYTHIGEGAYPETESAIQALLAEPGS
ncbi:MAG TPA: redoxin domain-containing protein [Anaerolineaceae bacterium]|jgi:thiol-disulfide isomerase/thioredoxin